MLTDAQVKKQQKKHKKEADRNLAAQRDNTKRCRAFHAGDYMEYMDRVQFATAAGQKKRAMVQINQIKPYVSAVQGFMSQNRRKPKYIARMEVNTDQRFMLQDMYSKYANTLSDYCRESMRADQMETMQDGDMLTCGLGVVETALTYGDGYASTNANGDFSFNNIDLDTYWWDYRARQKNLVDRRYDGITKQYHVDEALELFKGSEEEDFETNNDTNMTAYQYQGDLGSYDRIKYDWSNKQEGMIFVHFYQYYAIESYWRADNPIPSLKNPASHQAAMMELQAIHAEVHADDEQFEPTDEILAFNDATKTLLEKAFGDFIECTEFRRKVFYTAIISGDKCFQHFKSICQDGFTTQVKTGEYDAKNKLWVGMVNSLMEPMKYYNKALTELMFIIAANSKGGVIIEDDAVEDIEEFEDQYAKTDAVCVVRPGAIANTKIRDKRQPFQPTGYESIIQLSQQALQDVSGIDKTFLGSAENRTDNATLMRQRIRQITATLACYVDSDILYLKDQARLMLDLMRVYAENNRGNLFRVLGEQGIKQFVMISEDKLAAEYDIEIGEAPVTPEERAEIADKLTAMGDKMLAGQQPQQAAALYAMAAKYMSLDTQDLQEVQKILAPQDAPIDPNYVKQLEQLVQQLQSAQTQAQVDTMKAEAQKLMSDAALNQQKLADTRAATHLKAAQTTKTVEEATKTQVETTIMKAAPHRAGVLHPLPPPVKPPTAGARA